MCVVFGPVCLFRRTLVYICTLSNTLLAHFLAVPYTCSKIIHLTPFLVGDYSSRLCVGETDVLWGRTKKTTHKQRGWQEFSCLGRDGEGEGKREPTRGSLAFMRLLTIKGRQSLSTTRKPSHANHTQEGRALQTRQRSGQSSCRTHAEQTESE